MRINLEDLCTEHRLTTHIFKEFCLNNINNFNIFVLTTGTITIQQIDVEILIQAYKDDWDQKNCLQKSFKKKG